MEPISSASLISFIVSLIGGLLVKFFGIKEKRKSETKTLEKEIENLDSISQSLIGLQKFIDDQKSSLLENEKTILELEKKQEQLKPVVETQQQTVDAILRAHSNSQKKSRWFDHLLGFFIGVASSALVTLIFYYFQSGK